MLACLQIVYFHVSNVHAAGTAGSEIMKPSGAFSKYNLVGEVVPDKGKIASKTVLQ